MHANLVSLAMAYKIPVDRNNTKFREFGPKLLQQWFANLSLRTGSNPSLSLTPTGLDIEPLKAAFAARYAPPSSSLRVIGPTPRSCARVRALSVTKTQLSWSGALGNIELANGEVVSNRASKLRDLRLEQDQRIVNAKAKADPKADEEWGLCTARAAHARDRLTLTDSCLRVVPCV